MPHLVDFQDPAEPSRWRAINDDVMGGVSRGEMGEEDSVGVFSGARVRLA